MVGVKAMVDKGINKVPEDFVKHQFDPVPAETIDLPVVDLAGAEAGPEARSLVVEAIRKASEEWSGFQLIGHGVSLELMQSTAGLVHRFFSLNEKERAIYYSEDQSIPFRFGSSNVYNTGVRQWYDYLFVSCPPKQEALPSNIPGFREIVTEYATRVDEATRKLLHLFSEALGLEPGVLKDALGDVTESHTMRCNYYPPCPDPNLAIGSDGHTDPGAFTLLQQDPEVEGLQVYHEGSWKLAKPMLGAFVINIADQLEILSNGRFKSLKHRVVVNSAKPRVSVVSFYYPQGLRYVCPLPQLVGEGKPPGYKGNIFPGYIEVFRTSVFTEKTALEKAKILPEDNFHDKKNEVTVSVKDNLENKTTVCMPNISGEVQRAGLDTANMPVSATIQENSSEENHPPIASPEQIASEENITVTGTKLPHKESQGLMINCKH